MKKVRLITLMMVIALTQLGADPTATTQESDIDQLIKSVKEKLEKRRQERAQQEQLKPQSPQELEESEYEELIVPEKESETHNQNDSSSRVTPSETSKQATFALPTPAKRRTYAKAKGQNVNDYPEASFPRNLNITFQPAKKNNWQQEVAERDVSFPASYIPSFQPPAKRLKKD